MPQSGFFMNLDEPNAISPVSQQHWNSSSSFIVLQWRMFFNNISSWLINLLQSCHCGSGGQQGSSWKHEGFQREFAGQTWGQKMSEVRCPPVTWSDFPLLPPLITVSDGKWWKSGGGVMDRWRDLGKKGLGVAVRWGCVWNAMNLQNEPRGISPF